MKHNFFFRLALLTVLLTSVASAQTPLSDGKTFTGWEGNTTTQWRIEDGAFTSGSLEKKQPYNDYLATTKEFGDFELTLKWKLEGTEGFVNGGVQFRSKRLRHRRTRSPAFRRTSAQAMTVRSTTMRVATKSCSGLRRKCWQRRKSPSVNGTITAFAPKARAFRSGSMACRPWTTPRPNPTIATTGIIAVQIHGNSYAIVRYKDIAITELPAVKGK